ncbi:MAG: hypothetical protein A3J27_01930 [Candidatus Tectomicrobia bacterium RIFCSPLOWO2_12_FULL_69_37]|nr:MAG: hypothetical protein A3J27_01930 [Candidatus Tectomicrobia bacterium RIFCSPLOWO2_12_FULL_69_37]
MFPPAAEGDVRHRGVPILIALLLWGGLAGCTAVIAPFASREEIRLEPIRSLDEQLYKHRLFFAEYLKESRTTTERVAVLAEDLPEPLRMILDPGRYVSGETGAEPLTALARRLAPLRLFAVLGRDGRRLGYAFLPGGQTLRLLHFTRGIYTFDLSPGG